MSLSRNELLDGAIQLLRHYERCGVTAMPRADETWANTWSVETVASKLPAPPLSSGEESSLASGRGVSVQPPTITASPAIENQNSTIKNPSSFLEVAQGAWSGLVLSTDERAEAFRRLNETVRDCVKCKELACSRKQTVFGVGSLHPRVVLFGEAPGAEEDRQGEPFVGPAGQLLNKIIVAAKMKREEVYILNSLKCRPPNNRTPVDEEIGNCRPFFEKQLDVLQPEYIVCLGAVAARAVLQTTESVGRLRGRFHRYRSAKVLVTYHPSYLLRNEGAKKFVWDDMQMLMREMGLLPK